MAGAQVTAALRDERILPPANDDFYEIADILDAKKRAIVGRARAFMGSGDAPTISTVGPRSPAEKQLLAAGPIELKLSAGNSISS